jgi:hypothetical protein
MSHLLEKVETWEKCPLSPGQALNLPDPALCHLSGGYQAVVCLGFPPATASCFGFLLAFQPTYILTTLAYLAPSFLFFNTPSSQLSLHHTPSSVLIRPNITRLANSCDSQLRTNGSTCR